MDLHSLTGIVIYSLRDQFAKGIKESTVKYNEKVEVALQEASNTSSGRAKDMKMWKRGGGLMTRNVLVVVPRDRELRRNITAAYHDSPTPGYPGRDSKRLLLTGHDLGCQQINQWMSNPSKSKANKR